jgi:hypothetical protein
VSVSEARRFELHRELQNALGEDVAHTLMEYLPPIGWADVARRRDVEAVERRLNVVIGGGLAFALAIVAVQVQILLTVADIASRVG